GQGLEILAKASSLGEQLYVMSGAYYDKSGLIIPHPGSYIFNAPGAQHGGYLDQPDPALSLL
ncbi:MAG: hypothetical protein VXZ99_18645, partial [Pseudomonadota bacterium]|nr:hypothetical protein [Pseudomonadota bacterium]